jgi:hypothetical protein
VDLDQAHALWSRGWLPREELPEVATAALVAGLDSPSLRVLAGLTAAELDRAHDLFNQVIRELGRPPPAPEVAVRWQAVMEAQAIVAGAVPAHQGANALWWLWNDTSDEELQAALLDFEFDQERWEWATPEARPPIEREIVEHAREFIDRWTPRGE